MSRFASQQSTLNYQPSAFPPSSFLLPTFFVKLIDLRVVTYLEN
jgi:hypothetical protein